MKYRNLLQLLVNCIICLSCCFVVSSCERDERTITIDPNPELEAEVNKLKTELEQSKSNFKQAELKLEKSLEDLKKAEANLVVEKTEKKKVQQEKDRAVELKDAAVIEKIEAENNLKISKEQVAKANANVIKAKAEIERLKSTTDSGDADTDQDLIKANLELKKFVEDLEEANTKLTDAELKVNTLNTQLIELESNLAEIKERFTLSNTALAQANVNLTLANTELEILKAELEEKKAEIEKIKSDSDKTSEDNDSVSGGDNSEKDPENDSENNSENNSDTDTKNQDGIVKCGEFNYNPKNLTCIKPVGNGNDGCLNSDGLFVSTRNVVSNPCNTKLAILDIEINLGIDIDDDFVENHCGYQGQPPSINPKITVADAKIYFVKLFGEKIGNEFGDLLNTNGDLWLDRNEATAAKGADSRQLLNLPVKSGLGTDDVLAYLGLYLGDGALDKYAGDLGEEVMRNLQSFTRTWQPGATSSSKKYNLD